MNNVHTLLTPNTHKCSLMYEVTRKQMPLKFCYGYPKRNKQPKGMPVGLSYSHTLSYGSESSKKDYFTCSNMVKYRIIYEEKYEYYCPSHFKDKIPV